MSTISVDYDVLNQRGSPAWFTDTFANIPTAGYVGRMFISKDTFAFYRDTGTGWDLIGGPGIGTLTGSGVVGQVSFFNGTQVLAGNNNLFWDNTNSRLGINTTTPGQPLDIHSTGNTLVQLNNTTTANSNISFQNQNVAKWRVGNLYNAGANSFDIQNATTSTTALSISNTTNQITLISQLNGTSADFSSSVSALELLLDSVGTASATFVKNTSGTGVISTGSNQIGFNLNNAFFITSDNKGCSIFSFNHSSSTYTYTLPSANGTIALTSDITSAISGTTNTLAKFTSANVIGNSGVSDDGTNLTYTSTAKATLLVKAANNTFYGQLAFTNGSNASYGGISYNNSGQYMQFETNTSEWMRLGNNGNLLINTTTDAGYKLDVNGTGRFTGALIGTSATFSSANSVISNNQGIKVYSTDSQAADLGGGISFGGNYVGTSTTADFANIKSGKDNSTSGNYAGYLAFSTNAQATGNVERMRITSVGELLCGTTNDAFYNGSVQGTGLFGNNGFIAASRNGGSSAFFNRYTSTGDIVNFRYQGSNVGAINYNGTTTTLVPTSDERLKENIVYADSGLDKLSKIKIRAYDWIESGIHTDFGIIAQEIFEVAPECVSVGNDEIDENGKLKNPWGAQPYVLIAAAVKAIQELNEKLVRNNIN